MTTHSFFADPQITQITQFKKTIKEMHKINRPVVLYGLGALAGFFGGPILPLATLAFWVGAAGIFYELKEYRAVHSRFDKERLEMVVLYTELMKGEVRDKLTDTRIQDLIITLSPWVPLETIRLWEEKDLKEKNWRTTLGLSDGNMDREDLKEFCSILRKIENGKHNNYAEWYACNMEGITDKIQSVISAGTRMISAAT